MHTGKTLMGERVLYYKQGNPRAHVAFVIETHQDPHTACLVYYCPDSHEWVEALNVRFGYADGRDYYTNPEA